MAALDAHAVALELLAVAVESLETLPVDYPGPDPASLLGAPERRGVVWGTPVMDCEQLVVWIPSIGEAPTITSGALGVGERGRLGSVNYLPLTVMCVRDCQPGPTGGAKVKLPSIESLTAASRQGNADAWVMWCGIKRARKLGRFNGLCGAVEMGRAVPQPPSGTMAAWSVPIEVQLDGYRPDIEEPGS